MPPILFFIASTLVVPVSPVRPGPPEQVVDRSSDGLPDRSISGVSNSTFTVFLPPADRATGVGILICPGGGYSHLAIDKEGVEVAAKLNSLGIAGFVLKYRLPIPPGSKAKLPLDDAAASARFAAAPIEDAESAIGIIRARAAEFHINPDRLGMMGFSAGGHLTALIGTRIDGAARPNFIALVYPAVPLGIAADSATPPAFIAQADNDQSAPVDNTVLFYLALRKSHVPSELHIYATGGHAFGVRMHGTTSDEWMAAFVAWLRDRHVLASQ